MISFFQNITTMLGAVVDFIVHLPQRLVQLISMLLGAVGYTDTVIALMPPALGVFALAVIACCVFHFFRDIL